MDTLVGPKANGADAVKNSTTASFEADVIQASRDTPIIVDFWAPWCGPCKQLGPLLEKTVTATKGKVRMVKVDIDQNPEIAQALRIQSIPTVYAFYQGRPIDGFMGAVPESQLKDFVGKLASLVGANEDDPVIALLSAAKDAETAGDSTEAQTLYTEILDADPANALARAGLARLHITGGHLAGARKLLDETPAEAKKHAEIIAAKTSLELAEQSSKIGPAAELQIKLDKNPDDHETRFELAMAHYAAGNREGAVDELLDLIKRDRSWNEEQARKQLVKFFEAFGPTDPLTVAARRRLSSLLFK